MYTAVGIQWYFLPQMVTHASKKGRLGLERHQEDGIIGDRTS